MTDREAIIAAALYAEAYPRLRRKGLAPRDAARVALVEDVEHGLDVLRGVATGMSYANGARDAARAMLGMDRATPPVEEPRAWDCEPGDECGRVGCPRCQQ